MTSENVNTDLETSTKHEVETKEEKTVPGRFYAPDTDIVETDAALILTMDMPGVSKDQVNVKLEKDILSIEGYIDLSAYEDMKPSYSEYPLGHYSRSFTLSSKVDQSAIQAAMDDGVLTLTLPKAKEAVARQISVN